MSDRYRIRAVLALAFVLGTATPFLAQASGKIPTGPEIVQRHVDAVGGQAALDRVRSFRVRGSYEYRGLPEAGTIELVFRRPQNLIFHVHLPGYGDIEQGLAGELGWSLQPGQEPEVVEGGEKLDGLRKWAARGFSLLPGSPEIQAGQDVEVVELDDRPAYKVAMRFVGSSEEWFDYYDRETGLLIGRDETVQTTAGETEMRARAADYRDFDGVRIATRWTHEAAGQHWVATYTSFEINDVSDAQLAPPTELAGKNAATATKTGG